ncbi:transcriptional regulator (plasmid) [Azospirillum baldaniorum]|uniref:Transcriptional regulator n=2 Tax=Azospirillum baldaniorum TaxID=1064539 RepID=A0A9P1NR88_9PROT|nr:transcriptional regulator [Azospirillum baldaniorum]AWJ93341.1 transcriptional regulator [Azospirillum baldaniorum]CCD02854.1 putative transcriptional regulator [Azospirillum baldaniorum]
MLTAGQIRAARAWLGWKQAELAEASGVALQTVKFIEQGRTEDPRSSSLDKIEAAFRTHGLEFFDGNSPLPPGGPGVRLRDASPDTKGGEP